jgi:hypothetical protein
MFGEAPLNLRRIVFLLSEIFGVWVRPRTAGAGEASCVAGNLPH